MEEVRLTVGLGRTLSAYVLFVVRVVVVSVRVTTTLDGTVVNATGCPVITPVGLTVRPLGSPVALHEKLPDPPVALRVVVGYGCVGVPVGSTGVMMDSGPYTVTKNAALTVCTPSVTWTPTAPGPAADNGGVPDSTPLDETVHQDGDPGSADHT
jgi:hypothetical protein